MAAPMNTAGTERLRHTAPSGRGTPPDQVNDAITHAGGGQQPEDHVERATDRAAQRQEATHCERVPDEPGDQERGDADHEQVRPPQPPLDAGSEQRPG